MNDVKKDGSSTLGVGVYDVESTSFETWSIESGTYSFASRSLTIYGYGSTEAASYRTEMNACFDPNSSLRATCYLETCVLNVYALIGIRGHMLYKASRSISQSPNTIERICTHLCLGCLCYFDSRVVT
jgi:hypothetical protein